MSWAILSGRIAAEAIITQRGAGRGPLGLHARYATALRREVLPELRKAYWFGRLAYKYKEPIFKLVSRLSFDGDVFTKMTRSRVSYRALIARMFRQLIRF